MTAPDHWRGVADTVLDGIRRQVAAPPPGAGAVLGVLCRVPGATAGAIGAAVRAAVAGLYPGADVTAWASESVAGVGWVRVNVPMRGADA
jgi:hypothetical protein